MKWGPEHAQKHDLSSLRLLGSVGEPINPEAWIWYRDHIGGGRTPVVDTWWQTETGMILISPLPGVHAEAGLGHPPFPASRRPCSTSRATRSPRAPAAYLVIKNPWPAMLRGLYQDDERYRDTYWSRFPGCTSPGTGPGSTGRRLLADGPDRRRDERVGAPDSTIEVESGLVDHPEVAEAAVYRSPTR